MTQIITEEVIYQQPVTFGVLPKQFVGTLIGTTPSVKNVCIFKGSGVVLTVTKFVDGAVGQRISILGDGTTTVSHNAVIKTNLGVNKLLLTEKMYNFTLINNVWYEDGA